MAAIVLDLRCNSVPLQSGLEGNSHDCLWAVEMIPRRIPHQSADASARLSTTTTSERPLWTFSEMHSRGIILRYLSVLAVLALALTGYILYTIRPPYALYDGIFQLEVKESQDSIRNTADSKYVKFKQLQGAGFNNQVRTFHLSHRHLLILALGPGNPLIPPSRSANGQNLRLSALHLASER